MAGPSRSTDDDEYYWEYEYDDHETEDFYFTLDLTSHVSDALVEPEKKRRHRASKKADLEKQFTPAEPQPADSSAKTAAIIANKDADEPPGELQLIGLHTENPFVRFNDRHYSCYWATDLGTQVHISKAGASAEPVRKGYVVDVVSTSRVKLYGRPVTFKERVKPNAAQTPAPTSVTAIRAGGADDVLVVRPGQLLKVPEERITDAKSRTQASFLERLSAIKVKKGETDFVPVAPVKNYVMPANKAEIRQRALDAKSDESRISAQQASPSLGAAALGKRSFSDMQGPEDRLPAATVQSEAVAYDVPIWTSSAAHTMLQYGSDTLVQRPRSS